MKLHKLTFILSVLIALLAWAMVFAVIAEARSIRDLTIEYVDLIDNCGGGSYLKELPEGMIYAGCYDAPTEHIQISTRITKAKQKQVLIHEFAHFMTYDASLEEQQEAFGFSSTTDWTTVRERVADRYKQKVFIWNLPQKELDFYKKYEDLLTY